MKKLLILSVLLSNTLLANFADYFGASSFSMATGNQFSNNSLRAENNYYSPALIAFTNEIAFSASSYFVTYDFNPIANVQVKNQSSHSRNETGSVSTDYESSKIFALHTILPIAHESGLKLGVSFFSPIGTLQKSDTGDGFLPEYVMYRSQFERMSLYTNIAYPINQNWAISVGAFNGIQVAADSNLISGTNTDNRSSGRLVMKAKPSLSFLLSIAHKDIDSSSFFTFQQEMKSEFENSVLGEAANPIGITYDFLMTSLLYYDPYIFRFGHAQSFDNLTLTGTLEYQVWNSYEPPTLTYQQRAGTIASSGNYEQINVKNIFIPKLGLEYKATESLSILSGYSFAQTPLDSDFSGSGNSIDSNKHILSIGSSYQTLLFGKKIKLDAGLQYHVLQEVEVTKTNGEENGASGNKIGYPGYTVGGNILAFSLGLNLAI